MFNEIEFHIKNKSPVELYYNNDTGKWLWAVQVCFSELWLDAFENKEQAIKFCEDNELGVLENA